MRYFLSTDDFLPNCPGSVVQEPGLAVDLIFRELVSLVLRIAEGGRKFGADSVREVLESGEKVGQDERIMNIITKVSEVNQVRKVNQVKRSTRSERSTRSVRATRSERSDRSKMATK